LNMLRSWRLTNGSPRIDEDPVVVAAFVLGSEVVPEIAKIIKKGSKEIARTIKKGSKEIARTSSDLEVLDLKSRIRACLKSMCATGSEQAIEAMGDLAVKVGDVCYELILAQLNELAEREDSLGQTAQLMIDNGLPFRLSQKVGRTIGGWFMGNFKGDSVRSKRRDELIAATARRNT